MRTVVFLVKNGIGFGHIRRALLLAEAVREAGRLRPVIISQAHSLALYGHSRVPVINFPLLHRVPSAITEDWYTDVLDRLLERLDPAVVVEDTYPDARYGTLSSLADRPRLLVMRRLDGASFDTIRQRGNFDRYDQILIAQDEAAFAREGHSRDSLAAVACTGRFTFVGNIAHTPTADQIAEVRTEYAPDGAPLVVVNGGAGGDQMPDGYGDRLFGACHTAAGRLAVQGTPARFVLITGPYYAGRPLPETANVTVRRFEPRLSALLAAATVAVIKPGNNALSEALAGSAHLVLVPDVSFMEGLDEHAARIADDYHGVVTNPDPDEIHRAITDALPRPARTHRTPAGTRAINHVTALIDRYAEGGEAVRVTSKHLLLVILAPAGIDSRRIRRVLPPTLHNAVLVDDVEAGPYPLVGRASTFPPSDGRQAPELLLIDTDVTARTPQELVNRGIRMLLHAPSATPAVTRWLTHRPPQTTLLHASAHTVHAARHSSGAFARRVTQLLRDQVSACLIVKLDTLGSQRQHRYLCQIGQWLAAQPLRLITTHDFLTHHSQRLLRATA